MPPPPQVISYCGAGGAPPLRATITQPPAEQWREKPAPNASPRAFNKLQTSSRIQLCSCPDPPVGVGYRLRCTVLDQVSVLMDRTHEEIWLD